VGQKNFSLPQGNVYDGWEMWDFDCEVPDEWGRGVGLGKFLSVFHGVRWGGSDEYKQSLGKYIIFR
jgi:hypothetical protein